ncbi:MAG TPA: TonB-dependent receptor [Rhizomicrobium sp.]|nr:TonB-dependent receptor [Rhizomicrobium sp.]
MLGTAGILALSLVAHRAHAQDVEQVQVTGTRIVQDGYSAPTPVTVIDSAQINAVAPANLADFVNQLPAVIGSVTPNNSQGSISAGTAGLNALNLRSLGTSRTLVLLNGHRVAASDATSDVDINTFPQELVKRVDVVTGGASADYGSDAVGGVVNFVLDTQYTGFKTSFEYGETTYGENPNYKGSATWGTDFGGGRGHFLLSGEIYTAQGIPNTPRSWNNGAYFKIINPAFQGPLLSTPSNGQPYYLVTGGAYPSQTTPGGLIVSGPLKGTYFGTGASVNQLNYGSVSGPWMLGGDGQVTSANYYGGESLAASELRQNVFSRVSYYVTPDIEVYAEAGYAKYHGKSNYMTDWANVGGVTIQSDNAFLPASVRTALQNANTTSFTMGTTNQGLPPPGTNNSRSNYHFTGGADGSFSAFGGDYKWDFYAQDSKTDTHELTLGNWNVAKMAAAQDAVVAPAGNSAGIAAGTIVCRSTLTNPTNGCVPLSRIGINGGLQSPSAYAAGIAYVEGPQPYRNEHLEEVSTGFNVSGSPFSDWAGPVSIAFGGEWRKEAINGFVPTQYQSGWLYGNYLVNRGHYSVAEGYIETAVPIMQGMDFNGAFRYTAYSTSGGVNTWKVGLNYQPIDDLKFRLTYSHDIRAPNLSELFAAGIARANTVLINNISYAFQQNQTGNPNLSPEAANSLGVGVVLTPTFVPGLTASVDYYNINVAHEIGTIGAQTVATLCYVQHVDSYCQNIAATGTGANMVISTIHLTPINFSAQKLQGIDFDLTYQVPLDAVDWLGKIPGDLTLHALATHYIENYTNDGIDPTTDTAGVNVGSGSPNWVFRAQATYHTNPWTFDIIGRGVSAGKYSNEYIQCTSGCPVATVGHYTVNYNSIPGAFYLDTNVTYDFTAYGSEAELFFAVKNLFNTDPVPVANGPDGLNTPAYFQTNSNLYDTMGRVFRMGVRVSF